MKVRRTITLGVGAAVGASAMYLLDPEHGPRRRREAARSAWQRAREGLQGDPVVVLDEARRTTRTLAERAREGFEGARRELA